MSISYENLSVLVIDDMGTARKFAQNTLSRLNFNRGNVFLAKNSKEAMQLIHDRGGFDLILCDYNLGKDEINGQQILENIKINKLISNESVFFMVTAESNLQMVSAALEHMPDHYISKPYQPKFLSDRIQDTLNKKKILSKVFSYEFKHQWAEAIAECDIALDNNPKFSYYILNYKAQILKDSKSYKEAAFIYHKLSQKQPDNYAFLLHFAECQFYLNNLDTSEILLKKILIKNPKNVKTYDLLSNIEKERKNYIEAQNYKEEAVRISPNSIERQESLLHLAEKNHDHIIIDKSLKNIVKLDLNSFNNDHRRHIRFIESSLDKHFYSKEKINRKDLIILSNTIKNNLKMFQNVKEEDKMNFLIMDLLINLNIADVSHSKKIYKIIKDYNLEYLFGHKYFYLIFEEAYSHKLYDEVKEMLSHIDIYSYPSTVFEEAYINLISNHISVKKIDIVKSLNKSGIKNFENSNFSKSYYQFTRALDKIEQDHSFNVPKISIALNTAQSLQQLIESNDNRHNLNIEKEKLNIYNLLNGLDKNDIQKPNRNRFMKFYQYYSNK